MVNVIDNKARNRANMMPIGIKVVDDKGNAVHTAKTDLGTNYISLESKWFGSSSNNNGGNTDPDKPIDPDNPTEQVLSSDVPLFDGDSATVILDKIDSSLSNLSSRGIKVEFNDYIIVNNPNDQSKKDRISLSTLGFKKSIIIAKKDLVFGSPIQLNNPNTKFDQKGASTHNPPYSMDIDQKIGSSDWSSSFQYSQEPIVISKSGDNIVALNNSNKISLKLDLSISYDIKVSTNNFKHTSNALTITDVKTV